MACASSSRAEERLDQYEQTRAAAEGERDSAMDLLWAVVAGGLAEPAGVSAPEKRNVIAARSSPHSYPADHRAGTAG
jgi:hypothetical protein